MKKRSSANKAATNSSDNFATESLLNELIFLGSVTKDVKIDKFTFSIKTLTESEHRDILEKLMKIPEDKRLVCVKAMTLSKSIKSINGILFDDIVTQKLNSESKESTPDSLEITKNEIILLLQNSVTNELFIRYEELLEESREVIGGREVKN